MAPVIIGGFNYASGLSLEEYNEQIAEKKEALTNAHKQYNFCNSKGALHNCKKATGMKEGQWYNEIKRLEREIPLLEDERDEITSTVETSLKLETAREEENRLANLRGAAQVKKYGLFAGIATALGLLVFITIKKFR